MANTEKIKMTFICNQEWDSMKVTSNGRYCDSCKKEVHNFTNKSVKEINSIKSTAGELCGIFKIEQIEPDLIPIEFNFVKKLKYVAATVATFFGLELSNAKAQKTNDTPTEINSGSETTITTNENIQNGRCVLVVKEDNEEKIETESIQHIAKRKHKYYLSKRFPFIHKRRYRMMGAYAF